MIDFEFVSPTKIYFGKNKEDEIGQIISLYNFSNILIICGQHSYKDGLVQKVIKNIESYHINYLLHVGVRANPDVNTVKQILSKIKNIKIDLILAIGGGSVIDTAKSVSVSYFYDKDPFDFNIKKAIAKKALPIGVILTLSASGSELSSSCVIQNDETHVKVGFNSDLIRPLFAVMNPTLTYTVPYNQKMYGVIDIISHSLERFFNESNSDSLADSFALSIIKTTLKNAYRLKEDNPYDYSAHGEIMLCSSFSHNGITGIGKVFSMPVHQLEHALSGLYNHIPHGAGLALLLPRWMDYYKNIDIDKFDIFAKNIYDSHLLDKKENAKLGVERFKEDIYNLTNIKDYKDLGIT
ncbi:MAG: iron-containing alcohol dehydrogenase, partial [Bacilli bacterium]